MHRPGFDDVDETIPVIDPQFKVGDKVIFKSLRNVEHNIIHTIHRITQGPHGPRCWLNEYNTVYADQDYLELAPDHKETP